MTCTTYHGHERACFGGTRWQQSYRRGIAAEHGLNGVEKDRWLADDLYARAEAAGHPAAIKARERLRTNAKLYDKQAAPSLATSLLPNNHHRPLRRDRQQACVKLQSAL